jgi:DnaK suppressor protein
VPDVWRRHHARLLELRETVIQDTQELSSAAAEAASVSSRQPVEVAGDCFDRELALGLLSYEQNALNEIDEALRRIHEGCYGVCELTGEPIPRRRLEAIPWARHTVEAQAELERASEMPRTKLKGA